MTYLFTDIAGDEQIPAQRFEHRPRGGDSLIWNDGAYIVQGDPARYERKEIAGQLRWQIVLIVARVPGKFPKK